jgi:hypothetical protein
MCLVCSFFPWALLGQGPLQSQHYCSLTGVTDCFLHYCHPESLYKDPTLLSKQLRLECPHQLVLWLKEWRKDGKGTATHLQVTGVWEQSACVCEWTLPDAEASWTHKAILCFARKNAIIKMVSKQAPTSGNAHIPRARPAREAAPRQDMSKWAGLSIFWSIKSDVICMTKPFLQTPPSALRGARHQGGHNRSITVPCVWVTDYS